MNMARLGDFDFALDTTAFQTMERTSSYKWAKIERMGRKPVLQFTGPESESFSLSGVIYPHFKGGLGQMAQLRAMAGDGAPYDFFITDENVGDYVGAFVIERIRDTRTIFFSNGAPRKIEFVIELTEFGE